MDAQKAPLNGQKQATESAPKALARSVGELGAEFVTLAELQIQLGWEDFRTATKKAAIGLAAAIVAAGCAIGGLPVLVLGLAEMLVRFFGWERWATLLGLGTLTVGLSAALAYYGAKKVFQDFAVFRRSKDELLRNLEWLKTIAKRKNTPETAVETPAD
jgi:hypothetical protein